MSATKPSTLPFPLPPGHTAYHLLSSTSGFQLGFALLPEGQQPPEVGDMSLLPWQDEGFTSCSADPVMTSENPTLSLSFHSDVSIPSKTISNHVKKQEVQHLVKNLASQMLSSVREVKNEHLKPELKKLSNPFGKSSIYLEYFTKVKTSGLEIKANRKQKVSCNLCRGKIISYGNISTHMKKYHVPEEECPTCGQEVPALDIPEHRRRCNRPHKNTEMKSNTEVQLNNSREYLHLNPDQENKKSETLFRKNRGEKSVVEFKSNNVLKPEEYVNEIIEPKIKEPNEYSPATTNSSTVSVSSRVKESISKVTMKYQERSFCLMLEQGKPVKKVMKKLSLQLGLELGILVFTNKDRRLNGREKMQELDGEVIMVTRMI